MTRLATWTDDVDDVELGCVVYSRTCVGPYDWPRGGVVVRIEQDGDDDEVLSVTVLEWSGVGRDRFPSTYDIPRVDIAEPGDQFFSADARHAADGVMQWASSKRGPKDPAVKARWFLMAANLAEVASHSLYLPSAERRFQRDQARKRAEWDAQTAAAS